MTVSVLYHPKDEFRKYTLPGYLSLIPQFRLTKLLYVKRARFAGVPRLRVPRLRERQGAKLKVEKPGIHVYHRGHGDTKGRQIQSHHEVHEVNEENT